MTMMKNGIKYVLIFAAGAAAGALATWKFVEAKYKQIAEEEIKSVREVYRTKLAVPASTETDISSESDEAPTVSEKQEYEEIINDLGYVNKEGGKDLEVKPYIISPDEFGEFSDYQTISLTLYADGVVENEYGEVLVNEEVEALVGSDYLEHFGEYEDDSVFIRNEELEVDYEILRDNNNYSDVSQFGEADE